jgi:uncharacterized protein (DUF1778 family)
MNKTDTKMTKRLQIRMSPADRELISRKASQHNLSMGAYLRRCALNRPMSSIADQDALRELRRQGGLIKHLASTDRQNAYEYRVALNLIQETILRICRSS